mmetsp:Transcript_68926/g.139787  ORF Transcript_68926/g.139787 Transcript_68926/m.139787 type:complete len:206 (+) Transcript_68926:428-1045(+)
MRTPAFAFAVGFKISGSVSVFGFLAGGESSTVGTSMVTGEGLSADGISGAFAFAVGFNKVWLIPSSLLRLAGRASFFVCTSSAAVFAADLCMPAPGAPGAFALAVGCNWLGVSKLRFVASWRTAAIVFGLGGEASLKSAWTIVGCAGEASSELSSSITSSSINFLGMLMRQTLTAISEPDSSNTPNATTSFTETWTLRPSSRISG